MDFRRATVQYGDYRGEVAIDGYNISDLDKMAKDRGLPDTRFLVGISFYGGEGSLQDGWISVRFAAVDKSRYGESLDDINKNAKSSGNINVEIFDGGRMPLAEQFRYIKRMDVRAVNRGFGGLRVECPDGSL